MNLLTKFGNMRCSQRSKDVHKFNHVYNILTTKMVSNGVVSHVYNILMTVPKIRMKTMNID
jgi:hypothetical protein